MRLFCFSKPCWFSISSLAPTVELAHLFTSIRFLNIRSLCQFVLLPLLGEGGHAFDVVGKGCNINHPAFG